MARERPSYVRQEHSKVFVMTERSNSWGSDMLHRKDSVPLSLIDTQKGHTR